MKKEKKAHKGKRGVFDPSSKEPYRLSRSKIEFFLRCPRCFYLDRRRGVSQPEGPPFTLNSAVDELLKKEFDIHRAEKKPHPLMEAYGIRAIPFQHEMMDEWRENFKGVRHYHKPTNFVVTGAVDDIWISPKGELMVVDYKATSTRSEITLNSEYRQAYKRQMEVYQWLLRQNGFTVSDTGCFVYANGERDRKAFDGKLEFSVQVIPYVGNASWVEPKLIAARACLMGELPDPSPLCGFCAYRRAAGEWESEDKK